MACDSLILVDEWRVAGVVCAAALALLILARWRQ